MSHFLIEEEIVEVCKSLHRRNLLAAADGNVSFRLSNEKILITPTGKNKSKISIQDLAIITLDNKVLSGNPSTERLMHLEIYKNVPIAKAVVHAHPPTAIAWSVARPELKELPSDCMSEVILALGRVPIVPYTRPGTEEMGKALRNFLPQNRVMILSRHGAVSWGEDLEEAYNGMERLEHISQILKSASELGGLHSLPKAEVDALWEIRNKSGGRTL